jgi:hypothetical protein
MTRSLLLALLVALPLAGCDSYGLDPITNPPVDNPPVDNPPVDNPPPGGIDTAALAAALGCDGMGLAQMDGAVGGALTETDCTLDADRFPLHDGGEFLDGFAFRLADSTTVRLDLQAGGFDAVLVLLDEDMDVVAYNDDMEPGNPAPDENARVELALAPGTYVAVATSFHDGERGTYALTMSER